MIKHGLLENHGWFYGWFPRHVMKPLRFDNDGPHLVMVIPHYIHCFLLLRHNHLYWFAITCVYIYICIHIHVCVFVFLWFFEPLLVYITKAAIITNIHIYIYAYTYIYIYIYIYIYTYIVTRTNIFSQWIYYISITTSWSYFLWIYNHVNMISYDYIFGRFSSHIYCTYPICSMYGIFTNIWATIGV